MKRIGYVFAIVAIVAMAVWTYRVHYDTKSALGRIEALRDRIAEVKESMRVLRVEWAWLNAPERLAALVARHNDVLGLVPMSADDFAFVGIVPFPPPPAAVPDPAPLAEPDAEEVVAVSYPPPPGMPLPPARPVREAAPVAEAQR